MDWIALSRDLIHASPFVGAAYAGVMAMHAIVTGQATTREIGSPVRTISLSARPLSFLLHILFHAAAASLFLAMGLVMFHGATPRWIVNILQAMSFP
jgi:hypothetical protein